MRFLILLDGHTSAPPGAAETKMQSGKALFSFRLFRKSIFLLILLVWTFDHTSAPPEAAATNIL